MYVTVTVSGEDIVYDTLGSGSDNKQDLYFLNNFEEV